MWQAFIKFKSYEAGEVVILVRYSDGTQEQLASYRTTSPSPDYPGPLIKQRLAELAGLDILAASIVVDDKVPFVPPADKPPEPPDPLAQAKHNLYDALSSYEVAVKINNAGGSIDLVPLKQAVADAQAAVEALS